MPPEGAIRRVAVGAADRLPGRRMLHAVALLTAAGVVSVVAFQAEANPAHRPALVLGLWFASLVTFLAGAAWIRPDETQRRAKVPFSRIEVIALLVLVGAALLVRTIALDRIPENFSGDEGEMGRVAREILAGHWNDMFTTGWLGHPTLWFYLQALSLKTFGDGVLGLRILTALVGVATVAALYFFARRLYGHWTAVIAAVLLAVYHFHVHYSRMGLNNATDALFALVGFGLLLAGWQTRSPLALGAAGVSLGVAQSFYFGSRLSVVVLVGFLAHQLLVSRAAVAAVARYLPLTVLGFLIGWGPGLRVPLYHWQDYNARLAQIGIFQSGWFEAERDRGESAMDILIRQVVDSAGAITSVVDRSGFYWPEMPLLDPVSSALFLVGLAAVVHRWRRPESGLLLAWLVAALFFGGVLLVNTPESHHFVTLAPLICLFVALGLDLIRRLVVRAVPRARLVAAALTAVAVAGLVAWNVSFYFGEYTPRQSFGGRPTESATAIARFLAARERPYVYFVGPPFVYLGNGSIAFIARKPPGYDVPQRVGADGLPPPPAGRSPVVVFVPPRADEAAAVWRRYPGTAIRTYRSSVDRAPLFSAYAPSRRDWQPRPPSDAVTRNTVERAAGRARP
jgi:4-amino-4-deoxy-L-arabinose transferase-like glycosyltransferase